MTNGQFTSWSPPDAKEIEILESGLGEAKVLFKDGYTNLSRVAAKHGFAEIFGKHLIKTYLESKAITDQRIKECIMSVAHYSCENDYCFVIHSQGLLNLGFTEKEIHRLTDVLELSDSFEDKEKWSQVMRLTYFAFRDKKMMSENIKSIKSILTAEEMEDYASVLSLAKFLEFLVISFKDEIKIEEEALLRDESGKISKEIASFITYYRKKKLEEIGNDEIPVMTICSYCKDIRDANDQWHKIEDFIGKIPPQTEFSHGICHRCLDNQLRSLPSYDSTP